MAPKLRILFWCFFEFIYDILQNISLHLETLYGYEFEYDYVHFAIEDHREGRQEASFEAAAADF